MFKFFGEEKVMIFVGGIMMGIVGSQLLKTKKVRELAVQGIAKGMILKDSVMEEVSNIKEEVEDVCNEAKVKAKGECDCDCECKEA